MIGGHTYFQQIATKITNKIINGKQCTLFIHVDDILATHVDQSALDEVYNQLKEVFVTVDYHTGNDLNYLGMQIHIDDEHVTVKMSGYVDMILKDYDHVKQYTTPALPDVLTVPKDSPTLDEPQRKRFHTIVARLAYYTQRIRPAIALPVAYLSGRVTKATVSDKVKLNRVMGYVKATRDVGLIYKCRKGDYSVHGYVDASLGCHMDGKSHSGIVVYIDGNPIYTASTKQTLIARHSTEAEIVAASDKVKFITSCQEFISHQGYDVPPPILYQDNQSAQGMMEKGTGEDRTVHMRTRKYSVKELVDEKDLVIQYASTDVMWADGLTKALQGSKFVIMSNMVQKGEC